MLAYVIVIQTTEQGIATDMMNLTDPKKASDAERKLAGVYDIALRLAGEFVAKAVGKGIMIEGKHIEEVVAAGLKDIGAFNLRQSLRDAGYELPSE